MKAEPKAYAAALGFTVIFCIHYLAAARLLADVPPVVLGAWRGVVGGGFLLLLCRRHLGFLKEPKRAATALAMGIFGFCLNQVLLLEGLKRSTAADAAVITICIPLVSTLLALLIHAERVTARQGFGLAFGFVALLGFFLAKGSGNLGGHLLGDGLILLNVVSLSLALVLGKGLLRSAHEGAVTAVMLSTGGLILAVASGGDVVTSLPAVLLSPVNLALLGFEVFVVTIVGYYLNLYALRRLPVAATTSMTYLQPPITAALGFAVLGQAADPWILPLFFAVIASTWLVRPR